MRIFKVFIALFLVLGLAACGGNSGSGPGPKFREYHGPEVTQVQVHKAARKLYLLHNDRVLRHYDVALGFNPVGHKQFEGDGKTPEGAYYINYKNPNSEYHLSLMVSYPNPLDRSFARSQGKSPGGDIFIHGGPKRPTSRADWTAGCVAVTDEEMEEVYSMVRQGTPIFLLP